MARFPLACATGIIAAAWLLMPAGAAETVTPSRSTLVIPPDLSQPIGSYANGCIQGAHELPPEGLGYQVWKVSERRNFGHPELLDYIAGLADRVMAEGLGRLAIGDLSLPLGGRMEGDHASHQIGLDADIWFNIDQPSIPRSRREGPDFQSMVNGETQRVSPERFGPGQMRLLRLAAEDGRVTRIFVNPAIKLALCEAEGGDRSWLRKVRPWFGHAAHFHVRLECPEGAASCTPQNPPPPGDGCGDELLSWFEPPKETPGEAGPPPVPPPPPAACLALFGQPSP